MASEWPEGESTLIHLVARREGGDSPPDASVCLTHAQRQRSRQRVSLDDGRVAGVLLERGGSLREGDLLVSDAGLVVLVRAAPEEVSTVRGDDPLALTRAAYHLGNRHVALEIAPGRLRYLHDHVLDGMVRGLGLSVSVETVPFEPEPGAYGAGGHTHHQG